MNRTRVLFLLPFKKPNTVVHNHAKSHGFACEGTMEDGCAVAARGRQQRTEDEQRRPPRKIGWAGPFVSGLAPWAFDRLDHNQTKQNLC